MRCAFSRIIPVYPKYGGVKGVRAPCGKCMACRINKTTDWATRLYLELPYFDKTSYITLTYADEYLPDKGSLRKEDLTNFWKRMRKMYGNGLKYYGCGEYGEDPECTNRPHYHGIVFGADFAPWTLHHYQDGRPIYTSDSLADLWPYGHVTVDDVTLTDIEYVTGYVRKKLLGKGAVEYEMRGVIPPFNVQSKGLGSRYANDHSTQLVDNMFVTINGKRRPLPKYISKKLGLSDGAFLLPSPLEKKAIEEEQRRLEKFEKMTFSTDQPESFYHFDRDVRIQKEMELRKNSALFAERNKV